MRQVHLSELHLAALRLAPLGQSAQRKVIDQALDDAHCADKYRKRLRRAHPRLGNGTLISALSGHLTASPRAVNHYAYLGAMHILIDEILTRRGRRRGTS